MTAVGGSRASRLRLLAVDLASSSLAGAAVFAVMVRAASERRWVTGDGRDAPGNDTSIGRLGHVRPIGRL